MSKADARLFVGYYRVSTGKQSLSGLALDAQRQSVRNYVAERNGHLVAEFAETASGRKKNRPRLNDAVSLCRIARATLAIARLDRLSRSVELTSRLMDSGLDFVAIDFPEANRFTIHILAAVAEYEAGLQSERMTVVLAALKKRGRNVGNLRRDYTRQFPPGCQRLSALARQARSEARARDLLPLIRDAVAQGKSYSLIAKEFNESGVRPPRDAPWTKNSIWRIVRHTSSPALESATPRLGAAQVRVRRLADAAGPILQALCARKATYVEMADELESRGIASPWGRRWGPTSIRRYLMRSLNLPELRSVGSTT
jgi:DNA invertase Pin-like site-specific DNA recombinase